MKAKQKLGQILILPIALLFVQLGSNAQMSGNQVYGNYNGNNNTYHNNQGQHSNQKRTISTSDSTLNISINILMNEEADSYIATLGISNEAATVLECNKAINSRIKQLKTDLEPFGIGADDFYIDFVSQTKVYDYQVNTKLAKEYENGFEIKKNIILKIDELDYMDELIELAAKQEIYDIIKVEYICEDIEKIYGQLYDEAVTLLKSRKKRYLDTCPLDLTGDSRIVADNFYTISPKTQYKRYQAFETSQISVHNNYSDNYIQKEARKHTTFYYDGVPTSGFDKIINPTVTRIGLQYVFNLSVVYDIAAKK